MMRSTGISKKINPIGRIIIPIELRKALNTEPNNPLII